MKKIIVMTLALIPALAAAEYDVERIKAEMQGTKILEIKSWEKLKAGDAWLAKHNLDNTVISVGESNTGLVATIADQPQAVNAMLSCMMVGNIGLELNDNRVAEAVSGAVTKGEKRIIKANHAAFSVEPKELGNAVTLSCFVAPES